jgi:hypothetical protein
LLICDAAFDHFRGRDFFEVYGDRLWQDLELKKKNYFRKFANFQFSSDEDSLPLIGPGEELTWMGRIGLEAFSAWRREDKRHLWAQGKRQWGCDFFCPPCSAPR